jgi:hypothetical protein
VKLIAASPDLLDPVLNGLVVGKLMDDDAVGVRRLALVDSKLLAVAQGNTPAAVTLHRFHDLGYDLAVVGLGSSTLVWMMTKTLIALSLTTSRASGAFFSIHALRPPLFAFSNEAASSHFKMT